MYYSWHQTINTFTNLIVAATLISCLMSSLTNACGSKGTSGVTTTPDPGPRGKQVFRFRREPEVIDMGEEDDSSISTPASTVLDELDRVLDKNFNDDVSVIEWTRDGNSVNDFWKLLDIYDKDGNDLISRTEVAQVHKELSKEHPLNTS